MAKGLLPCQMQRPKPEKKKDEVSYQQAIYDEHRSRIEYIGGLFKGTMSIINEPDEKKLSIYSKEVYKNTPYKKENEKLSKGEAGNPIPMKVGDKSPIKYVFYVVKENRTYDQVLGDMPGGNGDTSLYCLANASLPTNTNWQKNLYCLIIFMWMVK